MGNQTVGGASREIFDVLADITVKVGNGTLLLPELKRFAKRENPFSPARISKKLRTEWEVFYRNELGMDLDLSGLTIPDNPGDFDRVLVIPRGLTIGQAIAACVKHFKVWTYLDDLDENVTMNERTSANGSYAIRVRDRIEADEELKNLSANDVKTQGLLTETLLERLVHGLKYFSETGKHLDISSRTLCSGARYSDYDVPGVNWGRSGVGLGVGWYNPGYHYDSLRPRAVVP